MKHMFRLIKEVPKRNLLPHYEKVGTESFQEKPFSQWWLQKSIYHVRFFKITKPNKESLFSFYLSLTH